MASLVALLVGIVFRFLIPDFFSTPGILSGAATSLALFAVLFAFFLPFLLWRKTVGYVGAIIMSIIALAGQTAATVGMADAGGLSGGFLLNLIIPTYIFAVLLIVSSVLAWREG